MNGCLASPVPAARFSYAVAFSISCRFTKRRCILMMLGSLVHAKAGSLAILFLALAAAFAVAVPALFCKAVAVLTVFNADIMSAHPFFRAAVMARVPEFNNRTFLTWSSMPARECSPERRYLFKSTRSMWDGIMTAAYPAGKKPADLKESLAGQFCWPCNIKITTPTLKVHVVGRGTNNELLKLQFLVARSLGVLDSWFLDLDDLKTWNWNWTWIRMEYVNVIASW